MHSIKSVFCVILWICSMTLMEESLKHKICHETWRKIDSAIVPFDQHFVFLISGELMYKMDINGTELAINSVKKLENWSPDIKPTIEIIEMDKTAPYTLILRNCLLRKLWIIRYDDNGVKNSRTSVCPKDFEHILEPISGLNIFLNYNSLQDKILVFYGTFYGNKWQPIKVLVLGNLIDEPSAIKLLNESDPYELKDTGQFAEINGAKLNAAFIYDKYWYLFADRHYCRVRLNEYSFQTCKPFPINNLIKDCNEESSVEKPNQNKDLSVFMIVVFIIIAIAVIVIVVMAVFIYREVQKKATHT